eukprot:2457804-Lingulodinium_polyedra.AAC.1
MANRWMPAPRSCGRAQVADSQVERHDGFEHHVLRGCGRAFLANGWGAIWCGFRLTATTSELGLHA